MVTLLRGGRNCFWSNSEGPLVDFGSFRMAMTPTPSVSVCVRRVLWTWVSHGEDVLSKFVTNLSLRRLPQSLLPYEKL